MKKDIKKDMKKRISALILMLIITAATCMLAVHLGIDPPVANIAGAFASTAIGVMIAVVFKVPDFMYYLILIFIYFASPVGSVLNLYRSFGPYDKIVHFFSGIMIAAVAYLLYLKLLEKNQVDGEQYRKLIGVAVLFCFFASGAGAGIWEIMEFTMDKVAGGGMQRGMVDTITDMIAGNLGGICYGAVLYFQMKKQESGVRKDSVNKKISKNG